MLNRRGGTRRVDAGRSKQQDDSREWSPTSTLQSPTPNLRFACVSAFCEAQRAGGKKWKIKKIGEYWDEGCRMRDFARDEIVFNGVAFQ